MPKTFIKKTGGWTEIKSIFVKKTNGWAEVKNVFLKKTVNSVATWVKVFTKLSLPDTTTAPSIRTTNTGSGTIYDGPVATSPQYLNADLFGKDGVYTNYTSIFGRKFTRGSTSSALTRTTIVNDDRFTSAGGVTTAMRTACDEQFLFYELTVQNGSSANEIYPISPAIKMIKSYPVVTSFGWNETEAVGTELVFNYTLENYYYNSVESTSSYIRWWRSTNTDPGGTLLKEESINVTTTGTPSSTSRTGTSKYTPTSSDIGSYIVAEIIAVNSYTRHYGYTDNYSLGSFPTDGVIGSALTFSNVEVKDQLGRNGLDNRDRWPTDTINQFTGTLSGYDSNTVIRIRYRIYNFVTGLYWKPSTETQTTASAAWDSWTSDGSGNGYISDVSVNGSVATFSDYFTLPVLFNGGGDGPTWWLEIELSAVRGGPRVYYISPYETFYIGKAIDSTISVSPATVGLNTNVTISGSLTGFPATPSTNGYPRQYKVDYGDDTDSGWLPVNEYAYGTLNPTYSLTKSYSAAGTYTVSIDTIPYYEIETATVTVSTTKLPPTMGTPTISGLGDFVAGQRRLSVPFTAVTNSGPAYQIYWYPGENYLGNAKPPVTASVDGSGTTSPIRDESGPNGIGRYAVWIRSSATTTTTGSTAPSTTLSDWSDLQYVYISGTRTLSYNKNTTDTVGSLPSSTSGTDPWDGWVTTVSSNTPTRTGYTFNGYNTAADGTGTNYAASAAITLTSDVTLYVKWTPILYTITFDSKGGTSVSSLTQSTVGGSIAQPTNPTKTNNTFGGWSTTDGGTTAVTWPRTPAANETLYAIWSETPTTPTSLTATTNDKTKIRLTWSGGSGQTTMFYWSGGTTFRPDNTSTFADFTTNDASPYDFTTMARGSNYYFYVKSRSGTSPNFTYSTAWFPAQAPGVNGRAPYYAPGTPTSPSATANSSSQITFSWTAPTTPSPNPSGPDLAEGYDIYYSTSTTAPTSTTTPTTTSTTASKAITGLSALTEYHFWVRATNADNTGSNASSWTTRVSATTTSSFVTPAWNGTMPAWKNTGTNGTFNTDGSNFQRTSTALRYGWDNGTFSFSGSTTDTKGWDFYVSGTEPASTTTVRTPTHTRAYSTTANANAVHSTYFIYYVSPTYSSSSRYGSIRPYQYGTDGNKYVRGTQPNGTWSVSI